MLYYLDGNTDKATKLFQKSLSMLPKSEKLLEVINNDLFNFDNLKFDPLLQMALKNCKKTNQYPIFEYGLSQVNDQIDNFQIHSSFDLAFRLMKSCNLTEDSILTHLNYYIYLKFVCDFLNLKKLTKISKNIQFCLKNFANVFTEIFSSFLVVPIVNFFNIFGWNSIGRSEMKQILENLFLAEIKLCDENDIKYLSKACLLAKQLRLKYSCLAADALKLLMNGEPGALVEVKGIYTDFSKFVIFP